MKPKDITITIYDDDDEREVKLPSKLEICDRCRGTGSIVNPNIDGHGISREEFDEDPEFEEAYFAGRYDIGCPECDGQGRVSVIDEDRCDPHLLKAYYNDRRCIAEMDAIQRAERAMGA